MTEVRDLVTCLYRTACVSLEASILEEAEAASFIILRLIVRAEVVKFDVFEDGASIGIMVGKKDAR